jgi:hypothetical protein
MLGSQAVGALALGQGPNVPVVIATEAARRGPFHRRRWYYDPDRIVREWERAEAELQADIEEIEAAQEAARQAAEAKREDQRRIKAKALERSLNALELETSLLLQGLAELKAKAFADEVARVAAELAAMLDRAKAYELYLRRRRRDEEAMAMLLMSEF